MKVYGQLEKAALENLASASPTPTPTGGIYIDVTTPTAGVPRFYDGTQWQPILFGTDTDAVPVDSFNLINVGLAVSLAASAMQISLKQASGSDPSTGTSACTIAFRSATLSSGVVTNRTVTAALSTTISSGSTGGSSSGNASWIYVYAIDNAGTVELAWCGSNKWDQGTLVSTTAEGGAGAADDKYTLYSTSARSNVACRLIGRIKSTQATAGAWVTTPSEISVAPFGVISPRSELWLITANGYGSSTGTKIRRWTTIQKNNPGTALSLTQSSTAGDSITINEDGIYSISYVDQFSGGNYMGISLNSAQLTTAVQSATATTILGYTLTSGAGAPDCVCVTLELNAGDVIRAHTDSTVSGGNTSAEKFRIVQLSKL